MEEGCLSVRYLYGTVARATKATVSAYDENGKKFNKGASGIMAQIFQHEIDHLDGIAFTDKVSPIKLDQAKRKVKSTLKQMNKMQKEGIKLPNQPENQPST